MIKIVSFIAFIVALTWTWFLVNAQNPLSLEVHAGIQSKLMEMVGKSVKTARPNSSNFEILNIYTKKINATEISAHFSYKYTDRMENQESVTQMISAEATLHRAPSEDSQKSSWIVQAIKMNYTNLEFRQGMTVSPEGPKNEETIGTSLDTSAAPATEKKTQ